MILARLELGRRIGPCAKRRDDDREGGENHTGKNAHCSLRVS
jgi:hypothetical protein